MPALLHFQRAETSDVFDPAAQPTQPGGLGRSVQSMQLGKDNLDSKFSFNFSVSGGALPSRRAFLQIMNSPEVKNMSMLYLFLVVY